MRKLLLLLLLVFSFLISVGAATDDNGKLDLALSQLDKNNIEQQARGKSMIDDYNVAIFTPKAIAQYQANQAVKQAEQTNRGASLFLEKIAPQNLNPSATLFKHETAGLKSSVVHRTKYFDMSYLVYLFIGVLGVLLAIFVGYLLKGEQKEE
ncbi:MAG: hypothetical protein ACRC6X_03520 [Culicoidibacterales bacterium]